MEVSGIKKQKTLTIRINNQHYKIGIIEKWISTHLTIIHIYINEMHKITDQTITRWQFSKCDEKFEWI